MEKTADGNDRLFLQIAKNRAKAGRLVAGVAAASNSDMFKCRVVRGIEHFSSLLCSNIPTIGGCETTGQMLG